MLQRVLSPVVELRREEATTAVMMFGYSFLALTPFSSLESAAVGAVIIEQQLNMAAAAAKGAHATDSITVFLASVQNWLMSSTPSSSAIR